jgi:hypothetical protein
VKEEKGRKLKENPKDGKLSWVHGATLPNAIECIQYEINNKQNEEL